MTQTGIRWVTPPSELARAIEQYGDRVLVGVKAVADYIAGKAQDQMRNDARWTDRTGNARSGLFAVADAAANDAVIIYLSHGHTIEYGLWLEVANGGRYEVVMPTIEANLPVINRMLQNIFR